MIPTPCDCSLILPTRNRANILNDTLQRLIALPDRRFEIIVCDNGSTDATIRLHSKFSTVRWITLGENHGSAARNIAAVAARGWLLLMLDDDSWPDPGVITKLVEHFHHRLDLAAAGLRVMLVDPPRLHDAGGVAGIFFNCGGAVRRKAFLDAGGFPVNFDYYVEEYDLAARLWAAGWRIEPLGDLIIRHRRSTVNRDNNRMLRLLVRNNMRFWQRYAPRSRRDDLLRETILRYQRVAIKENAIEGFEQGLREGREELNRIRAKPLSPEHFDSLMGLHIARADLARWADKRRVKKIALWTRGKGCELLIDLIRDANIEIDAVYDDGAADSIWRGAPLRATNQFNPLSVDGLVVGSLSLGTSEDLAQELQRKYPALAVRSLIAWKNTVRMARPVSVA